MCSAVSAWGITDLNQTENHRRRSNFETLRYTEPHQSPVFDGELRPNGEEKIPEILTTQEIRDLLRKAREQNHPWYPIWVGAVFTGCISGCDDGAYEK